MSACDRSSLRSAAFPLVLFCIFLLPPQRSLAQGCTQCRDNTAATPIETQHAYRNAIGLLAVTAVGLCSVVLVIGRRFR